jgi:hypothetical protein
MFPIPLYPKQMCSQLGNKKPLWVSEPFWETCWKRDQNEQK